MTQITNVRGGTAACGATAPQDDFCPLISVVIPAYNAEKWIAECIGSVIVQTYTHWECIVVDDGSTDNTRAEAEAMKPACIGRLTVVSKPNGGAASARNAGLAVAKGDYVVFADADDLLLPQELEFAWRAQREQPDAMVIWDAGETECEPRYSAQCMNRSETMITFQFRGSWISPINKLYQRRVLDKMPMWFDEKIYKSASVGEDKDFVDRYAQYHWSMPGACCVYVSAQLYVVRHVNPDSLTIAYGRENKKMTDAREEDAPTPAYLAAKLAEIEQVASQSERFATDLEFRQEMVSHYLATLSYGIYSARRLKEPLPTDFWNSEPLQILLSVCQRQKCSPLYYLLFRARAAALITRVYVAKCRRSAFYYRLDKLAHLMLPGWK